MYLRNVACCVFRDIYIYLSLPLKYILSRCLCFVCYVGGRIYCNDPYHHDMGSVDSLLSVFVLRAIIKCFLELLCLHNPCENVVLLTCLLRAKVWHTRSDKISPVPSVLDSPCCCASCQPSSIQFFFLPNVG